MSETPKLGETPSRFDPRDAVHVAIIPVTVDYDAPKAGDRINISGVDGVFRAKKHEPRDYYDESYMAVLDPFSPFCYRGSVVWAMLKPGAVKSMRHDWTHPALMTEQVKKDAEERIRQFAASVERSYEVIMEGAAKYLVDESCLFGGDEFDCMTMPSTFWDDYEIVTGQLADPDKRGYFFRCAC